MIITDILKQRVGSKGYMIIGDSFISAGNLGGVMDNKNNLYYPVRLGYLADNTVCVIGHDDKNVYKVITLDDFLANYKKY